MKANLREEYPAIIGRTYKSTQHPHWPEVILEHADIHEDCFRLKDPGTPWLFECNYETFAFYWELKENHE